MSDKVTNSSSSGGNSVCGDAAALIAYLYDECEPRERDALSAHLASCSACAADLDALRDTRRMLPAWSPPEAALGCQIPGSEASARVLRPARWWQRPLPAWAQAAAAIAIFAAGLSAGRAREGVSPDATPAQRTAAVIDSGTPSAVAGGRAEPQTPVAAPPQETSRFVSSEDLARVERELRAELARLEQARAADAGLVRASVRPADTPPEGAVTLERVEWLIAESERRQRGELIVGMAQVLSDADSLRRRELAPVRRTVEGLGREVVTNRSSVAALAEAISVQSRIQRISTGR